MTEQTKIPVPNEGEEAKGPSLIERVVRNYDLVQLASAPIPENLIPPVAKRRRYRRADEVVEDAEVTPIVAAAAPKPEPAPVRTAVAIAALVGLPLGALLAVSRFPGRRWRGVR